MQETKFLTKEFDAEKVQSANDSIIRYLQDTLDYSKGESFRLRRKLTITYWILIILSSVLFIVGILLIMVPIMAAFSNNVDKLESLIAAGFGIADIAALFLYGPIEKIHKIMGDMSQLILVLTNQRSQVGLYLMEMDISKRSTIGDAAKEINQVTEKNVRLIQNYFEPKEISTRNSS
jgi:hypothetical protein